MKIDDKRQLGRKRSITSEVRTDEASSFERRLGEILTDLARILIFSGYGIAGVGRLMKRAYLEAAVELEVASGRRPNFARIAAITGMTRLEVSQLSQASKQRVAGAWAPVNRAQRVSLAWISDPEYCEHKGKPNILPFSGRRGSFEKLVRSYSGDIPARAMFSEMLRLGMVREDVEKNVRLVRADSPISRRTTESLRALSPWTSFLSKGEGGRASEMRANTAQISLSFDSLPQLFAAVRQLQTSATALLDSAKELGSNRKRARPYKLDVSLALGTRVSSQSDSRTKKIRKSGS